MNDTVKVILAVISILVVFGVLGFMFYDAISCITSGGVYVKGVPFYTCLKD